MPATLLLTRPEASSARFAAACLARLGPRPVLIAPLMRIVTLEVPALPAAGSGAVSAVVFSSQHAVAALAGQWAGRPVAHCVGARTAAAARAAGFAAGLVAPDVAALAAALLAGDPAGGLLVARGRHVAGDLEGQLAAAGRQVVSALVYDQQPLPLPPAARALLSGAEPVEVPIFSPRSARLLHEAAGVLAEDRLNVAAMSDAVAHAAEPLRPRGIVVATRPEADAMIEALGRLSAQVRE